MLGRPVAFNTCNGHLEFFVTKNIDPICQYNKGPSMQQPAAITIDRNTAKVSKLKEYFCNERLYVTCILCVVSSLGICIRYRKLSYKSARY